MQQVQAHLLNVTAGPFLALLQPCEHGGDEDETFRATASIASSSSPLEDVCSPSPTTFTGCPEQSTSTIVSNSRLTLVVATPPQSTGPFTAHGACQQVCSQLGPGPNRWGRSALLRARGPCSKEGPYQDRPLLCPFRLSPLLTCS